MATLLPLAWLNLSVKINSYPLSWYDFSVTSAVIINNESILGYPYCGTRVPTNAFPHLSIPCFCIVLERALSNVCVVLVGFSHIHYLSRSSLYDNGIQSLAEGIFDNLIKIQTL